MIKPDTKRFKEEKPEETEEKPQLDDKHNADQKSGAKPEVGGICNQTHQGLHADRHINNTTYLEETKFLCLFTLTNVLY